MRRIKSVERRQDEYFYTGGLLPGAQIPLPRDKDIDVLEAITIATGGVGAPAVGSSGVQNLIRQGAGPGNILIPPTRVIIVRKTGTGRQLRISVDLVKAVHQAKERILIQPDDLVMLQFKSSEAACNTIFNWFNWNTSGSGTIVHTLN